MEIIFVDDCTPDNSIGVLKQVMDEYPDRKGLICILRHDHNRGLSAARNTGTDAATGEYIYYLDSDDEISKECIATLVKPIKTQIYDFVIGNFELINFPINNNTPKLTAKEGAIRGESVLNDYNAGLWYSMAVNKLVNRNFLISNKLYFKEGLIHEDELWSYKLAVLAKSMYVLRNVTYYYYHNFGSIMTSLHIEQEVDSFTTIIAEARNWQNELQLYSYNADYKIECFQDALYNRMCKAGCRSIRVWYYTIRGLDHRAFYEKWLCYRRPLRLLPFNFHWLLPKSMGFLYHKYYGFWRR